MKVDESPNEELSLEKRKQIFKQELEILLDKKLIPKTDYIRISNAYERHVQQMTRLEEKARLVTNREEQVQEQAPRIHTNITEEKWEQEGPAVEVTPTLSKISVTPESKKKIVAKVEKTSEQLRERNIAVVLITGVILLLFGGLIWATSTWDNLDAVLKVLCIGLVSVFFAGNAWIAFKLKIKQTAFAFLTLASLFLPITILSASYYQIFGEYLSLQGEGRGLLGFIGGLICLLIYFKIANYFQSKLFIFISFVTFTFTTFFGLAYFTFTYDVLFFMMAIFNLGFLFNLEKIKNIKKLVLFKPYGLQFITYKMTVEAFAMLTLFSSTTMYSFTLLITSVLFLLVAHRYNKVYFHYVFTVLFTYGYLHLVSNSILSQVDIIAFAILPFIFTGLFRYLKKENSVLSKSFMYTSLVISSFVFLYVFAMTFSEQETQVFLAFLILSAQFVFLSFEEKNKLFTYPAHLLFIISFVHLGFVFELSHSVLLHLLFVLQACLYLGLYLFNTNERWSLFRESALFISIFVLSGITLIKLIDQQWLALSILLAAISGLLLITYYKERSKQIETICSYGFPISLTLALISLHPYLIENSFYYEKNVEASIYLLLVSLVAIGLGYVWKEKEAHFFHVFYITGQVVSLLAFISLFNNSLPPIAVTLITLIIIGINGWSVHLYHQHWLWWPVLLTSIGAYCSLFAVFNFNSNSLDTAFYLFGPLLFLMISKVIGKWSSTGERYFFWYSQLMNAFAIPIGFAVIFFGDLSAWLYLFVLIIYVISALHAQIRWQKMMFAYIGFITLYLQVYLLVEDSQWIQYTISFTFMLTAGIILAIWGAANKQWKNIIEYYLLPYLFLAASVHVMEVLVKGFPSAEIPWGVAETILLGSIWYLLIRRKWEQVMAVPLLLGFLYFMIYSYELPLVSGVIVLFIWMIVMLLLSKRFYEGIMKRTESGIMIDYYRIVGFLFLLGMNRRVLIDDAPMILEIMVSFLVVVYVWVIRLWTIHQQERKIYLAGAITLCLYPYQMILNQFSIPDLWIVEVHILPLFIIGTILLRKIINRGNQTQIIEIIFVSLLFLILMIDALGGNTLQDALIIGTISLIAVIVGFIMKYKSFFLAGTGTILLNVYVNTNSLWGQMPWWFYLIIGGIVLIAAASFLEWKKQKENTTSKELLDKNKQRLKDWFNKWN